MNFREIIDSLMRNKSRSILTGFGVFWGVFMLIVLIGGGNGQRELLQNNFAGFATNSAMVWAQPTSKAYRGLPKGRSWSMDYRDVERLARQVPQLDRVAPVLFVGGKRAVNGEHTASCNVSGVTPEYADIQTPKIRYGRYLNALDMEQGRKVCVIGKRIYNDLFPEGGDPCGHSMRIDSVYYEIVGVDFRTGNSVSVGGPVDENVSVPITVVQRAYNRGSQVDVIAVTGRRGVVMSKLTGRIRSVVARSHNVDPTDEQGVMVFNTEVLFAMLDNLFRGVNFLVWLVGTGTLLAGAIGVSNIMMVTVKERTSEIGIRRAIGATPRMILGQIVAESVVLTAVAGMSGIMLGVAILQMIELGSTTDGIAAARFQVDFSTAFAAASMLCLLGGLAGLAPAWRAMKVKPVDAMREE